MFYFFIVVFSFVSTRLTRKSDREREFRMPSILDVANNLFSRLFSSLTFQVLVAVLLVYTFFPDLNRSHIIPGLPIAGKKWRLEPRVITRYRAVVGHFDIVTEAVKKVRLSRYAKIFWYYSLSDLLTDVPH